MGSRHEESLGLSKDRLVLDDYANQKITCFSFSSWYKRFFFLVSMAYVWSMLHYWESICTNPVDNRIPLLFYLKALICVMQRTFPCIAMHVEHVVQKPLSIHSHVREGGRENSYGGQSSYRVPSFL